MSTPELEPSNEPGDLVEAELNNLSRLQEIITNFVQLEQVINAILFARIINGTRAADGVIQANQTTFSEAQEWFPLFWQQMQDGWLLRQRAEEYERKGEEVLLQKLGSVQISRHVDGSSDFAELGTELSVSQFISLLALGMLYNLKSVNYSLLRRTENLGGNNDVARQLSFWMFNWQPENVFGQLKWLSDTGHWVVGTPLDLVENYPHQLLRFGHFVSALLIASQARSVGMQRVFKRKTTEQSVSNRRIQILIPNGMEIKVEPEDGKSDAVEPANTKTDDLYDGSVPPAISEFLEGLDFDLDLDL